MTAGHLDLVMEQGATFDRTLTWTDSNDVLVPLTGLTARMMIRAKVLDTDPLLTLTTENGRIVLTDPGSIRLLVSADDMAALDFKTGVYDLEIVDAGATPDRVTRLLQGTISLSREVTR